MAQDRPGLLIVPAAVDVDTAAAEADQRPRRSSSARTLAVGDAESMPLAGAGAAHGAAAATAPLEAAVAGPEGPALGKHEELPHNCTCGPKALRLRSDLGELVPVRGGCVNKCEYCATLAAVENCEMLVNDALEGDAPQLISILGTRTATLDMAAFDTGRRRVAQEVRRRWPAAQYAYEVEFTTGYGPRAGGRRRPHWNWFWKGIPRDHLDEFRRIVTTTWCRYVDAEPHAQYVAEISNAIGLTKYVTEHFMKTSQRPPEGFTGQRFCASRGYFRGITVTIARRRAKESLRLKRELYKALQAGHDAHDAELVAHQALELAARTVWVLATDRGARVGKTAHHPHRMTLPSDRLRARAAS